ncbi:hypothetical protein K474DRAFT_1709813 [Panus rudis PR-1116 ss-1]|nr:hypothetical protein K474DRAFT_1709813 [Panus rudis PR-1116 ss-1]
MPQPTLVLGQSNKQSLPTCSPHLMPFHIKYSGPAPVSTFFRPKKIPSPSLGTNTNVTMKTSSVVQAESTSTLIEDNVVTRSESQTTLVETQPSDESQAQPALDASVASSVATLAETASSLKLTSNQCADSEEKHYVAAFRGRTVRGIEVPLPQGYTGLVLRTPDSNTPSSSNTPSTKASTTQSKAKAATTSKSTRSSRRNARRARAATPPPDEDIEDADVEMAAGDVVSSEQVEEEEEGGETRVLTPTHTFSSFTLWHPDIPVDKGRDEYIRSLTEWMRLSEEIHHYDE